MSKKENCIMFLPPNCNHCKEVLERVNRIIPALKADVADGENLKIILSMRKVDGELHLENIECSQVLFG